MTRCEWSVCVRWRQSPSAAIVTYLVTQLLSYSVTWRYEARLLHTARLGQRAAAVGVAACASRAALVCLLIAEVVVRVGL